MTTSEKAPQPAKAARRILGSSSQAGEPGGGSPIDAAASMGVRSIRLPLRLWLELEEAAANGCGGKQTSVTVSVLVRAMLEYGLEHVDQLPTPGHDRRHTAARSKGPPTRNERGDPGVQGTGNTSEGHQDDELHRRFLAVVRERGVSARKFITSMGGDKGVLADFYYRGRLPEQPSGSEVIKAIERWIIGNT